MMPPPRPPQTLLGKALALIAGLGLLALTIAFSLIALPIILTLAIGLAGWFWWKTRALRKVMREQADMAAPGARSPGEQVIEGEFVRETPPATATNEPDQQRLLR